MEFESFTLSSAADSVRGANPILWRRPQFFENLLQFSFTKFHNINFGLSFHKTNDKIIIVSRFLYGVDVKIDSRNSLATTFLKSMLKTTGYEVSSLFRYI